MLHIEYGDVTNTVASIVEIDRGDNSNFTKVEHTFGRLRRLPINTCDFSNLVKIDFAHNRIETVSNISCLVIIEVIVLSHNEIKFISNTTLSSLRRLRHLNLSFNSMKTIDPNSLQGQDRSIFYINLSNNELETIDVTNVIFKNNYCEIDYDNNSQVQSFGNPTGFTVDRNTFYGETGTVSIANSSISRFLNVSDIGLLGRNWNTFQFRIDMADAKLACDCLAADFMKMYVDALQKVWFSQNRNVTCHAPDSLKGILVSDLVGSTKRDYMICDAPENCPKKCNCYSQPSQDHLVVNCSGAGLKKLPDTLPWGERYSLLFDGNDIDTFDKRDYLQRVHYADFSKTPLKNLPEVAIETLPHDVNLNFEDTRIQELPSAFALKAPYLISFRPLVIDCECYSIWMKYWKNKDDLSTSSKILCRNFDHIDIREMNEDLLDCRIAENTSVLFYIILSSIATFLMGIIIIFLCCRPEIYLLYRHHLLKRKEKPSECLYDIYISFDETNMFIMKWVKWHLLPYLEEQEYKVFLPSRDILPGESKIARKSAIEKCRTYVVFVTLKSSECWTEEDDADDGYFTFSDESLAEMEFSDILINFKADKTKRVVVINFENVKLKNIKNRYLKAYSRTRDMIDITNRKENIFCALTKKIGPPSVKVL
ncbi:hypothetical protein FSP39_019997 [Pinctada imbricata]|uniref:TIR domain-containing protein n=1 Tax=Pinctada imbricata TaxID=66713 RepID=A0AA88YQD0_PINIB|nr:hypothetical protein FSP39_019997 [Pinctada imbricata]